MSDYTSTFTKVTGNTVEASDFSTEFDAIQTASATKADKLNFTSTGIDDNATSTALTIDASENATFAGVIDVTGTASDAPITGRSSDPGSYSTFLDDTTTAAQYVAFGCIGDAASIRSGNVQALSLDSSQNATFAGKVNATSSDTPWFRTIDTTNSCTALLQSGDSSAIMGTTSAHNFIIYSHNASACTFDSSQNATFAGNVTATHALKSVTTGITAYAGGGQANAVALTTDMNVISVVGTDGDSVKLPSAAPGYEITVFNNDAAQIAVVFPASGDNMNGTLNLGANVVAGATTTFFCWDANNWESK